MKERRTGPGAGETATTPTINPGEFRTPIGPPSRQRSNSTSISLQSYGELNKHNPFVGYFIYAPAQSHSQDQHHHHHEQITTLTSEVMNQKKHSQHHPFTGSFHYAPGQYSQLYQLKKYRLPPSSSSFPSCEREKSEKHSATSTAVGSEVLFVPNLILQSVDDSLIGFHHKRNLKYFHQTQRPISSSRLKTSIVATSSSVPKMSLTLKEWRSSKLPTTDGEPPPLLPPTTHRSNSLSQLNHLSVLSVVPSSWQTHTSSGTQAPQHPPITTSHAMTEKYLLYPDCSLGEGSFARIYLGKNVHSSQYLAIKVIPLPPPATDSALHELPEIIENEILNQSRLWHRHVVKIHDVYKSSTALYLVMDYCSGGTLEQMLSLRNRLDEEETRVIAYQLLEGLCYCHRHGVLHGDIKPANIMFQPQSNSPLGNCEEMSPINLLCEKRRQEGKLSLSLHAPVVEDSAVKEGTEQVGRSDDLLADMKSALICESCVPKDETHGRPKLRQRRSVSECQQSLVPHQEQIGEGHLKQEETGERDDNQSQKQIRYRSPHGLLLMLCDFGLSQTIPNIKFFAQTGDISKAPYSASTPCGTQGYLSPEILEQQTYGLPADLWAVGVVLYKCLSGNFPFIPLDAYRHREVTFKGLVWKKVSVECQELIHALLRVNENDRLTVSDALSHRWFHEILLISNILVPSDEIPVSLAKTIEEALMEIRK
jgi:serine/threonine protein kinase